MPKEFLEKVLTGCADKLRAQLDTLKNQYPRFPHAVAGGAWTTSGDDEWNSLTDGYWTGGFWVGLLWLAHRLTGDSAFHVWGRRWMDALRPRADTTGMHDLGFIFFPSAAMGYSLTGDRDLAETAFRAAAGLNSRYSRRYRCLTIFHREPMNRIIAIDTMMNLPLLWWAAAATGNEVWERAARNHAATTAELMVRGDGSTYHIGYLDHDERKIINYESWQGRAPDSCWSRGQAWSIAGWAYALLFTGDQQYAAALDSALLYFRNRLPKDGIPLWDLDVSDDAENTGARHERDSSALAIAAHALLLSGNDMYRKHAAAWLESLARRCLVPPDKPGLLANVCFHRPAGIDTDCSCVFADFYFFLALMIATGGLEPRFFLPSKR